MEKLEARDWITALETVLDNKLKLWHRGCKIENGEAVQLAWQFEQTHVIIDIFWPNGKEAVKLRYFAPRAEHRYFWDGLTDETFNKIMDRVGNLAQMTMYPAIEH